MIDTEVGILNGLADLQLTLPDLAWPGGVAVDEQTGKALHVGIGATKPILKREEVLTNVLGSARDEPQDFWQPAQHLHLRGPGARGLAAATLGRLLIGRGGLAPKSLEQGHGARGWLGHVKAAHPGELDHIWRRHDADERIEGLSPLPQLLNDGKEMVFQKEHGDQDDVGRLNGRMDPLECGWLG